MLEKAPEFAELSNFCSLNVSEFLIKEVTRTVLV